MASSNNIQCPDRALLRQYEAGELADAETDVLDGHVRRCAICGKSLEEFRSGDLTSRLIRSAVSEQSTDSALDDSQSGLSGDSAELSNWQIADYERVRLSGEGAFGTVWAVRDRVGLYRALKVLNLSRLRSANVRCRESTALEAYCRNVPKHPNLVEIFHVGMQGESLYYTMDLADDDHTGRCARMQLPENYRPMTLQSVMRRGEIISADTAIEIVIRLLRGLERLHIVDLVHRDIKPANVIFVERNPKLADIGMITTESASASVVGTPEYMPPDSRMDPTADVYAMGRILFELLAGKDARGFPILPQHVHLATDNWQTTDIARVIAKAGARDGNDRYHSASEMLDALESCRELPLFAQLSKSRSTEASRPTRRTPVLIALINAIPWTVGAYLAYKLLNRFL
ncbi:MAG TPA: serine/threonine-protein kinase [Phycisphaerae bacterium]|nr:serine/threonine-protein kinase [Phycisphaerae bacterium]